MTRPYWHLAPGRSFSCAQCAGPVDVTFGPTSVAAVCRKCAAERVWDLTGDYFRGLRTDDVQVRERRPPVRLGPRRRGGRAMKPAERARAIREARAAGSSLEELVAEFDVSRRTVQRILAGEVFPKAGGPTSEPRRPGRPVATELDSRTTRKIRRLRERGATLIQLAKAVGCSTWTIRRILTEG